MVRKIAGKSPATNIKHLNNTEITEIPDIANFLGQTFSNNLSSNNYSTKFHGFSNQAENQHLKFESNNLETYNNPFSLDELQDAISKSHDSAVGPDDIHYQMLKHLPPNAVNTLLETLNNIWFAGNFPPSWRTSIRGRWIDEFRNDTSKTPADLMRQALGRSHHGRATRRPTLAMR